MQRTTGALANKPRAAAVLDAPPVLRPQSLASAVQGSLFTPNVIAMPSRGPATRTNRKSPTRRPKPVPEGQGQLDFLDATPPPRIECFDAQTQVKPKTLSTSVDASIYCEAPVATPLHRAVAAAIDCSMMLLGYGIFLAIFVLNGGSIVLTRANLLIFAGALAVVALSYGLVWTIARTETLGMRWMHLSLITFDGFPPDAWQRATRMAGTCLSVLSVLGVLWALADEEGLGWQDHISSTFPTSDDTDSAVYRPH